MADLLPCPFCGGKAHYTKEILSAGLAAVVMCSDNDCCTNHAETLQKAIDLWNTRSGTLIDEGTTRPDAPVERLETVAWQMQHRTGTWSDNISFIRSHAVRDWANDGFAYRALVTRSQAEAIIAAQAEHIATLESSLEAMEKRAQEAEADNAALTARVKELEAELGQTVRKLNCDNAEQFWKAIGKFNSRAEALETQLAVAEGALSYIIHTFTEDSHGNMKCMSGSDYQEMAKRYFAEKAKP